MKLGTLCFDFDGVIHSYTSGWKGAANIPDPPVPGILRTINDLLDKGFKIVVMSTRAASMEGAMAIDDWLASNQFPVSRIEVTNNKPPALLYIDDRGYRFDGDCDKLYNFIATSQMDPWNKD